MNIIKWPYISNELPQSADCGLASDIVIRIGDKMTSAVFNPTPFGEGRFRRAYRGTWTAPPEIAGRACVVKELKSNYTWKATDWDETVKINEKAQEMATAFNSQTNTSRPITYSDVKVLQVTRQGPNKTPKLNEYVTCEDYIPGNFTKWCNNYGYIGSGSSSLPAFMHWSWWYTDGEEMVADLQGVQRGDAYLLTDPVIMSLSQTYGATDTGVEGMAMFFLHHKTCNSFCSNLPKPTLAHFHRIIPPQYLQAAQTLLAQVGGSTTYKVELKFPQDIRSRVIARFREIARE